jgi:outer membrane protein assembly factor BamB
MTRLILSLTISVTVLALAGCSDPVEEIDASSAANLPKLATPTFDEADSPWWRGPGRDGHFAGAAPTDWSTTKNVVWKTPIPGRGHSSPTIVGDSIYLATAEDARQVQSVLAIDRETGDVNWQTPVHEGEFPTDSQMHPKSTHANGTVACDGERLYIAFLNDEEITITALDLSGEILWQTPICKYTSHYGHAASPCIHESLVILAAEDPDGGCIAAVHRETGDIVWRKPREGENYSSAVVAHVAGRDQLLLSGNLSVTSYDPLTGEQLWSCPGTAATTCGTVVWDDERVYASGGYPESMTICVDAATGREVWHNDRRCYEQSMLFHEGHLYAFDSDGVAFCWEGATGNERWKKRLGGPVSASLVEAGGLIYGSNETGTTFVFRADPAGYELVSENNLGDEAFASPTISGGRIYIRVAAHTGSGREEYLYCVGE